MQWSWPDAFQTLRFGATWYPLATHVFFGGHISVPKFSFMHSQSSLLLFLHVCSPCFICKPQPLAQNNDQTFFTCKWDTLTSNGLNLQTMARAITWGTARIHSKITCTNISILSNIRFVCIYIYMSHIFPVMVQQSFCAFQVVKRGPICRHHPSPGCQWRLKLRQLGWFIPNSVETSLSWYRL